MTIRSLVIVHFVCGLYYKLDDLCYIDVKMVSRVVLAIDNLCIQNSNFYISLLFSYKLQWYTVSDRNKMTL